MCGAAAREIVTLACADIDYVWPANCWILDRSGHAEAVTGVLRPFGRGLWLPERVRRGTAAIEAGALRLSIEETDHATCLRRRRRRLRSVRSRSTYRRETTGARVARCGDPVKRLHFQFTSEHNTRRATGTVSAGDRRWVIGETEDFAVQDLGRGIWPYSNRWNWAAGSGRSSTGRLIGLLFGGKWTEGTGCTEAARCIDGRLTKLSAELTRDYSWDEPTRPWRSPRSTSTSS